MHSQDTTVNKGFGRFLYQTSDIVAESSTFEIACDAALYRSNAAALIVIQIDNVTFRPMGTRIVVFFDSASFVIPTFLPS